MPAKRNKSAARKPQPTESIHEKILEADFANIAKKVAAGKPLTKTERELVQHQRAAKAESEADIKRAPALPLPTKKLGTALNMTAAANLTGLSEATVKRARDAGCRAFHESGRINCDELLTFCAEHPDLLEDEEGALNREREETLRIRADRIWRERRNEIQNGEYILRADVGQRLNAIAMAQRVILEDVIKDEATLTKLCRDMRKLADEWKV